MRAVLQIPRVGGEELEGALEGLVGLNLAHLRRNPGTPPLYRAGVRYRRERRERWKPIPDVLRDRCGDCEDLAAWRAAELRARGEPARVVVKRGGSRTWHALVERGDGHREDPSRALGMGARRRR